MLCVSPAGKINRSITLRHSLYMSGWYYQDNTRSDQTRLVETRSHSTFNACYDRLYSLANLLTLLDGIWHHVSTIVLVHDGHSILA